MDLMILLQGGVVTCYAVKNDAKDKLSLPLKYANTPPSNKLEGVMGVPAVYFGKSLTNEDELTAFFNKLAGYTNDGNATMVELSTPLKIEKLKEIIVTYEINFFPLHSPSLFSDVIYKSIQNNIPKDQRKTLTQGRLQSAFEELVKSMDENKVRKYKDSLGQFQIKPPSTPTNAIKILDRMILAQKMGLDDALWGPPA